MLDIGGPFLWVSRDLGYVSTSYSPAHCHSARCMVAGFFSRPRAGCKNGTCILLTENVFTSKFSAGDLSEDVLSLQSTNGLNPGPLVLAHRILFLSTPGFLSQGLADGAKGIVGLGHGPLGLATQLPNSFNFTRKFAMCLSPITNSEGVIFFGDGPYVLLPNIDISKILIYTPLIIKPSISMGREKPHDFSYEYFIRVKSIQVNGKDIPFNSSLLSIDHRGRGGTKISTINPYTVLESSIYKSFTDSFIREGNVAMLPPIEPFHTCFSTKYTDNNTMNRPSLPFIDLTLHNEQVFWRIFETNSIVQMGYDTACLAFVDGGLNLKTSIVLGGYQLEDNFLQFDLVTSRLGFSSSLLLRETSCADRKSVV